MTHSFYFYFLFLFQKYLLFYFLFLELMNQPNLLNVPENKPKDHHIQPSDKDQEHFASQNEKIKDLQALVTKLNTRIIYYQREKSKQWFQWKSKPYRCKSSKALIIEFLNHWIEKNLNSDDVPSIKEYSLQQFWNWLSRWDDNQI